MKLPRPESRGVEETFEDLFDLKCQSLQPLPLTARYLCLGLWRSDSCRSWGKELNGKCSI